jgi:hypothetical protein
MSAWNLSQSKVMGNVSSTGEKVIHITRGVVFCLKFIALQTNFVV